MCNMLGPSIIHYVEVAKDIMLKLQKHAYVHAYHMLIR
jgi:hypothetical protein